MQRVEMRQGENGPELHERVDRGRKLLRGDRDLASARSVARHILASHSDKRAQRLPCVRFGPELRKFPLQAQP